LHWSSRNIFPNIGKRLPFRSEKLVWYGVLANSTEGTTQAEKERQGDMATYTQDSNTSTTRWERPMIAGGIIAGALYIGALALFLGNIAPDMPPMDAPAVEHATFYAKQSRNDLYALIRYLIMAQLAPLALFFGALYGILRRAEGSSGALATAVLVAGVMASLITPLVEMVEGHLLLGLAAMGGDPVVTRAFDGMTPISFALSGFPQAVVLAGTAALLLSQQLTPRWIGWFGLGVAVFSLVSTGTLVMPSLFFLGTLSSILFKVWMVALSIVLLRKPRSAHESALQGLPV
jgi:hypothetical protein